MRRKASKPIDFQVPMRPGVMFYFASCNVRLYHQEDFQIGVWINDSWRIRIRGRICRSAFCEQSPARRACSNISWLDWKKKSNIKNELKMSFYTIFKRFEEVKHRLTQTGNAKKIWRGKPITFCIFDTVHSFSQHVSLKMLQVAKCGRQYYRVF